MEGALISDGATLQYKENGEGQRFERPGPGARQDDYLRRQDAVPLGVDASGCRVRPSLQHCVQDSEVRRRVVFP